MESALTHFPLHALYPMLIQVLHSIEVWPLMGTGPVVCVTHGNGMSQLHWLLSANWGLYTMAARQKESEGQLLILRGLPSLGLCGNFTPGKAWQMFRARQMHLSIRVSWECDVVPKQ